MGRGIPGSCFRRVDLVDGARLLCKKLALANRGTGHLERWIRKGSCALVGDVSESLVRIRLLDFLLSQKTCLVETLKVMQTRLLKAWV